MSNSTIHDVRDSFCLNKFLHSRKQAILAVNRAKDRVFHGMSESQGHQIIDEVLENMGVEKKWHPNKFRIGVNTTKSFKDKSLENVLLKENDLFFIDIGPVWENHEGDYGETFVFGESEEYEKITNAAKDVFSKTSDVWKEKGLSGKQLYQYAKEYAESIGYKLNTNMKGHRVGDFPHHLFYRGGISQIEESPCDNLWVLEIHLLSQDGCYGAFYEDILKK